ncbi:MAG: CAP domain-containing protein [Leptolyngbyaceae bacterium]|nr:CAP domain-containing protein [Leptolyngbyaceae bacterium]
MASTLEQALNLGQMPVKNVIRDWVGRSNNADFYTFSLSKSSSIKLNLGKLKDDLDLELLDFQGDQLARSQKAKSRREKIHETLEAGTYYVKVDRRGGASSYRLKTVLQEVESADSPIASVPLPVLAPATTPVVPPEADATKAERVALINEVLALTNVERTQNGLSPLTLNPLLSRAAQIQSEDLAFNDFFAHTSPTGVGLADRLNTAGYTRYQIAGENIGAGQLTAAQVVQEWMASPSHRANILKPDFTELGVGYYFLANDTGEVNYNRYWTQNFGAPMQ